MHNNNTMRRGGRTRATVENEKYKILKNQGRKVSLPGE